MTCCQELHIGNVHDNNELLLHAVHHVITANNDDETKKWKQNLNAVCGAILASAEPKTVHHLRPIVAELRRVITQELSGGRAMALSMAPDTTIVIRLLERRSESAITAGCHQRGGLGSQHVLG